MDLLPNSPERKLKLCVIPTCHGKRYDLVHKFPMDNERAQQWLDTISVPELASIPLDQIRKRYFICSKHFRKQDYKNCESRSLNKTAYPRLHLKLGDDDDCAESNEQIEYLVDDVLPVTEIKPEEHNEPVPIALTKVKSEKSSPVRLILNSSSNNARILTKPKRIIDSENVIPKRIRLIENPTLVQLQSKQLNEIPPVVGGTKDATPLILKKYTYVKLEERGNQSMTSNSLENTASNVNTYTRTNKEKHMPSDEKPKLLSFEHNKLEKPINVCSLWLRDHCRCEKCYGETAQRKYNILDIPLDVQPKDTKTIDDTIHIKWSDDHESVYNLLQLHDQLYKKPKPLAFEQKLWSKADIIDSDYARVTLNDYLGNSDAGEQVVKSLIKYGCAFIKNVPANLQSTEIAIRSLFPIQRTLFGEMWSFKDDKAHNDSAYSNEELLAHNDNTYFNDAAGLQVLHCISKPTTGGESLFVDGFNVLKTLQQQYPDAYNSLCKIPIPAEYIEDGYHFKHCAPVIHVDPITKKPNQIRFNMNDRAIFNNLPQDEVMEFYKSYQLLAKEIQKDENEWRFLLEPGTVCIFDNWRLLHGRSSYTGRRQIVGCYVARNEYLSVARRMGLID